MFYIYATYINIYSVEYIYLLLYLLVCVKIFE